LDGPAHHIRQLAVAREELAQMDAFAERYGAAYEMLGQIKATGFFRKTATVANLVLINQKSA